MRACGALVLLVLLSCVSSPRTAHEATTSHRGALVEDSEEFGVAGSVWVSASGGRDRPSLVWNGSNFFGIWLDVRDGSPHTLMGARFAGDGTQLDKPGIAIGNAVFSNAQPALAWNGASHLVAWQEATGTAPLTTGLFFVLLGPDGQRQGTPVHLPIANPSTHPVAVAAGANFLIAWTEDANVRRSMIKAVRVSPAGVVLDASPIVVTGTPSEKMDLALASNGTDFFLVWGSLAPSFASKLQGARITAHGLIAPVGEINIAALPAADLPAPRVAWTGTHYLVAWTDNRLSELHPFVARVNADGVVLDPEGTAAITTPGRDQIVRGLVPEPGGARLLYWEGSHKVMVGDVQGYHGVHVDLAGRAGSPSPVAIAGSRFAVARSPTETLVLDVRAVQLYMQLVARIFSLPLTLDWQPRGQASVAVLAASTETKPAAAINGGETLVVWEDDRASTGELAIYGARIPQTTNVPDAPGFLIADGSGRRSRPVVCSLGDGFLVAWAERSTSGNLIMAARVSKDQTVGESIQLSSSDAFEPGPLASATSPAGCLVLWRAAGGVRAAFVEPTVGSFKPEFLIAENVVGYEASQAAIWNGESFLVVWDHAALNPGIYAARVRAATLLDPTPIAIARGDLQSPAISWDGDNHLVAWSQSGGELEAAIVTAAGVVRDSKRIGLVPAGGFLRNPQMAFDGRAHTLVWTSLVNGLRKLHAIAIGSDARPLPGETVLTLATTGSIDPSARVVPSGKERTLALWNAYSPVHGAVRVRARFLAEAPAPIEPSAEASPPEAQPPEPPANETTDALDAGDAGAAPQPPRKSGCDCRIASEATPDSSGLLFLVVAAWMIFARRRRAHSA
jgi:hypothetical protein